MGQFCTILEAPATGALDMLSLLSNMSKSLVAQVALRALVVSGAGGARGTGYRYAVMEIPISKNNRRPTALFDCL